MRRFDNIRAPGFIVGVVVASLVLACSCGGDAKPPPTEPEPRATQVEQPSTESSEPAAPHEPAPDSPGAGDCVEECIRNNQMRAVAAEDIERDCKRECAQPAE